MRILLLCLLAGVTTCAAASDSPTPPQEKPALLVVVGAPGEKEYGPRFARWADHWTKAAQLAELKPIIIGLEAEAAGSVTDADRLKAALEEQPKDSSTELWLVLLGHGTFDGREAKFNLRGPDLAVTNLVTWLQPFKRPLMIINTASASAPFLKPLSAPGRVVVTATRSGYEQNYARFGEYFSAAISDPAADLDKDGQVSLLEAFLMAGHQVTEFYKAEGRLATEHPLLDDNGDGLGTPPDWFRGVRATRKPASGSSVDGLRAHQIHLVQSQAERKLAPHIRTQRNELELAINRLRDQKETLPTDEYYQQLEALLVDLARLYESSEAADSRP